MSASPSTTGLTTGGVTFLILAWGGIVALTAYCFYKLFETKDR